MLLSARHFRIASRLALLFLMLVHAPLAGAMGAAAAFAHAGANGASTSLIICTDDGYKTIALSEQTEESTEVHECLCPDGIGCSAANAEPQSPWFSHQLTGKTTSLLRGLTDGLTVPRAAALNPGSSRSPPPAFS